MRLQKSFQSTDTGVLYLVPTPIGNLEDMTFRAVRTLKEADIIFAEDTRQTRKLLSHFDISSPLDSYHEHNKENKGQKILTLLQEGKIIALVSDAGMPLVSDPGKEAVYQCIDAGFKVITLPGANAATTAITGSGLGGGPFYFYGFLPRKKKERENVLEELTYIEAPLIFYESPYRIKETIEHLERKWGDRKAVLARELTKKFEELWRGTLGKIREYLEEESVKGECCLIVEGGNAKEREQALWWETLTVSEHVNSYVVKGMTSKDAIKETAKERNLPKREVYAIYHHL
ncbi:16S rRNA (cytidine(1402)-2'-O)-methyltransferase [Alteribacillus bidgolensis]|uniref:Ribosomal RNA small subunit methyltransferase I n=1 Tax=Alteribacillus bidgolensis TaxID=930129 RepID=A0A1G8PWV2_9BACI|nr:16S rRNA (cytidine(1402)-2'-O)-methyltransferase [Alteribacillus bidgolensis]SDI96705.1 16S rRNA (cytidine1402-2'-O)-methyltransferase [Alteribacillus bidgolensis]